MVPQASDQCLRDFSLVVKGNAIPGRAVLFTTSLFQEHLLCFSHDLLVSPCLSLSVSVVIPWKAGASSVPHAAWLQLLGVGSQEGSWLLSSWARAAFSPHVCSSVLQDCKYNYRRIIKTAIEIITMICNQVALPFIESLNSRYWALYVCFICQCVSSFLQTCEAGIVALFLHTKKQRYRVSKPLICGHLRSNQQN